MLDLRRMRERTKTSMKRARLLVMMVPVLALAREMCDDT